MSSFAAEAVPRRRRRQLPLMVWTLLAWIVASAIGLAQRWGSIASLRLGDADDALRLVQVRDLLHGQAWWDVTQHRINPLAGGGIMHWSRIVDAPIAGGIALLTPITGAPLAERITLIAVPLLLLGLLFVILARLADRLGGRAVAIGAVALLAVTNMTLYQFLPLRIDHHGWQVMLQLAIALVLVRDGFGTRSGTITGLLASLLIAISIEGLPFTVIAAAIPAAMWWWTGAADVRRHLIAYLWSLTLGSIATLVLTRGPASLIQPWCDALSAPYLAAFGAAAIIVPLGLLPIVGGSRMARTILLALAATTAGAALIGVAPACSAGPFAALDPLVTTYWYHNVREGLPIWYGRDILFPFALAPLLVGLAGTATAARASEGEARARWLLMLAMLAGTSIVACMVIRASSAAHLFALPGLAWLGLALWRWASGLRHAALRVPASLLAALAAPPISGALLSLLMAPILAAPPPLPPRTVSVATEMANCSSSASLSALDRLAPALVFAPLDIGPHLLQNSRLSVIATGHHRNAAAMHEVIAAFMSDDADAERIIRASHAPYVVVCRDARELDAYIDASPNGLAAHLRTGRAPAWLDPVVIPGSGAFSIWRVR